MLDYLRRGFAPLSDHIWKALDEAVVQSARHAMTARRIASFDGPHGWEHIGARVGTMRPCAMPETKAAVCVPDVVILAEIRADFSLPWTAIEVFDRGAPGLDTSGAEASAREVALAEDVLLYYGEPTGSGFIASRRSPRVQAGNWAEPGRVVADVLKAVEVLDVAGIPGPYEAVLRPESYYAYLRATSADGGYPAARQLERVLRTVHRSVVLREVGAVFAMRGGDFIVTVGGDLSVGYRQHDRDAVHLTCVETVAAQTLTPEAVCILSEIDVPMAPGKPR
jgi:uncharacterized linocin/CFP29 family protein